MTIKADSLADRWTRALPWVRRAVLAGVLLVAALSSGLAPRGSTLDPIRPAGFERQHGESAVLREPEAIRFLRREAPDNRDRGGPGGDDTAARAMALGLQADLAAAAPRPFAMPAHAPHRRMARPEPRAPPRNRAA